MNVSFIITLYYHCPLLGLGLGVFVVVALLTTTKKIEIEIRLFLYLSIIHNNFKVYFKYIINV